MQNSKKSYNKAIRKKERPKKKQVKKEQSLDHYKWDTSQFLEPFDYKSLLK